MVHTGKSIERACRWACRPWHVTFDPSHVLPWAWREVKGWAVSVMGLTTAVGVCLQQNRGEGGEDVEWV